MQMSSNPIVPAGLTSPQPLDTGTTTNGSSDGSDTNSATITANDFLQLLVTEMQNQDPTATTDPNEYINQLVQVNSLEQLISINQILGGMGTTSSGAQPGVSGSGPVQTGAAVAATSGNLSATDTGSRASRIANALEAAGQTLAPGASGTPLESAITSLRSRAQQARTIVSNPSH